ncbi:MAG: DUF2608 domain-containing protein [Pseudomonadota bacterium]|jgi:hypothetical protein|nr:DUF2608 domain-containing protein [Alphaproteobacteria bacterium]
MFRFLRRVLHAFIFNFVIYGVSTEMAYLSVKDLKPCLDQLQAGDFLVIDIDDTVITPRAMMFRAQSPHHKIIDDLKKQPNSDPIVAIWRLGRHVMLVEPEWPEIIESLKSRGVIVIALTQMHTGTFASIPSVEKWRADELRSFGITFSPYATKTVETLINNAMPATLYQGILFTGSHSKVETFKAFIAKYGKPAKILFIDDRLEHVQALHAFCESVHIEYTGCHYKAALSLPYDPSQDFGDIQSQKLIEEHIWLDEAQIVTKSSDVHG